MVEDCLGGNGDVCSPYRRADGSIETDACFCKQRLGLSIPKD